MNALIILALAAVAAASKPGYYAPVVGVAPRPYFGGNVFGAKVEGVDAVKAVAFKGKGYGYGGYGYGAGLGYGYGYGLVDTPVYNVDLNVEKADGYYGYKVNPEVSVPGVVPVGPRPYDNISLFGRSKADVEDKQAAALDKYRSAAQKAYDAAAKYPYGLGYGYGLGLGYGYGYPYAAAKEE